MPRATQGHSPAVMPSARPCSCRSGMTAAKCCSSIQGGATSSASLSPSASPRWRPCHQRDSSPANAQPAGVGLGEVMVVTGFRLASPIIVLVFLINLFIAVVTRLSPQMNIFFSMGFILTIFGGEFIFLLSLPHMLTQHQDMVRAVLDLLPTILKDAGGTP